MAACLPASVVIGSAAKTPMSTAVTASIPKTFGVATIDWNVAFGETRMPIKRATRFFGAGAGVEPAPEAVVVIRFVVRERPDCTTPIYVGLGRNVSDSRGRTLTPCEVYRE